jgi:hypothetical protein
MNRRLTALIAFVLVTAVLVPPARAGTYEHRSLPGMDGWSPAVSTARGHVSVGVAAGGVWAGFFDRDPFDPGDLAEWSYAAPADTSVVAWGFDRQVSGIGGGDWNTLFSAISDGRRRLVAYDVPSANRGWGRVEAGGLSATRLEARLVCGGPRVCHRATGPAILWLRAARVVLHDGHAPTGAAVQGDLARDPVLSGVERLSFTATDRGGGVYRTIVSVDGRPITVAPVAADDARCRAAGGPHRFSYRVPCPLAAGMTVELDTRRLSDGPHTVAVAVEDAAGNRTTVLGPTTKTISNSPVSPTPPTTSPAPAPAPTTRAIVHAWLERGHRRVATATAPYGERVRIRGRITDPEGRPLAATPLAVTESLVVPGPTAIAARRNEIVAGRNEIVAHPTGIVARRRWPAVTGVRSRPDGRFTAFTRVGPSRRIGIVGPGGARAPRLTLRVRAAVSLAVARRGTRAFVRGRVRGGYVRRGTLVELQARRRGRWATRLAVRTRAGGRFDGRLTARGTVRARVPGQPRLPYAAGWSRAR